MYSFSLRISDWNDGVFDERLQSQIDEAIAAIRELERRGNYANVAIHPVETVEIGGHNFLYFDATLLVNDRNV